jgi:hypothetical protein
MSFPLLKRLHSSTALFFSFYIRLTLTLRDVTVRLELARPAAHPNSSPIHPFVPFLFFSSHLEYNAFFSIPM